MTVEKILKSGLLTVSLALAAACAPGSGAAHPAADPERQSVAEYDLATDLWLRQDRPRTALDHVLRAIELDDENADAHHLAALIYLRFCEIQERLGSAAPDDCRLDEAERHLRAALEERPDFREAKNTLGLVMILSKRYDEAIAVLKPLTADILYQTPEIAWGNLGWAYLERGRLDRALQSLQRAVAAEPSFCVGWYRLGLAKSRKKDLEGAEAAFTEALTRDPRCEGLQVAYLERSSVRVRLGHRQDARADLERCVELDPKSPQGKECAAKLSNLKYSRAPAWSRSDSTFATSAKREE